MVKIHFAFAIKFLNMRHTFSKFFDAGIAHPFDATVAEFMFHQCFGVTNTTEPHVADVGLRSNKSDRDAVTDLLLT